MAGGFNLLLQAADRSDSDSSGGTQSDNNQGLHLGSSVGINNSQAVSSRSLLYSNFTTAMNNNNNSSSVGELYHPQSTSLPPQPAKRTNSTTSLGPPKKRIRNHHASLISLSSVSTSGTWRGSYNSHTPNMTGLNSSMSSSVKKNEEWGTFKQDSPTVITSSGSTMAADVAADTNESIRRERDLRQLFNMSLIVPKEKANKVAARRLPSKNNKSGNKKLRLSHSKTKKKKELDCKDVNGNDICMGFFSSLLSSQKLSTDEAGKPSPQEDDSGTSSYKDQEQEGVVVPVPRSTKEEQNEASDSQVKNKQEKDDTYTEAFKLSLRKAYLKALRERFGEE